MPISGVLMKYMATNVVAFSKAGACAHHSYSPLPSSASMAMTVNVRIETRATDNHLPIPYSGKVKANMGNPVQ
jgi:hypothetical protein